MAARVIHFGVDDCYRLSVLRRAGYDIDDCSSLVQLQAALESKREADAVMVNDCNGSVPELAISLARSWSSAPIILFPNSSRTYNAEDEADLVVPSFTPPEEWLLKLANLIVRSRSLRAYSQLLQEQSQQLRRESSAVREESRQELERAGDAKSRQTDTADPDSSRN
jgi:hypothetical protein